MAAVEYDLGRSRGICLSVRAESLHATLRPMLLRMTPVIRKRRQTYTQSTVPDELSSHTERTRNTEQNSVEVLLVETVVGEEDTRVGVHIGPGVYTLESYPGRPYQVIDEVIPHLSLCAFAEQVRNKKTHSWPCRPRAGCWAQSCRSGQQA